MSVIKRRDPFECPFGCTGCQAVVICCAIAAQRMRASERLKVGNVSHAQTRRLAQREWRLVALRAALRRSKEPGQDPLTHAWVEGVCPTQPYEQTDVEARVAQELPDGQVCNGLQIGHKARSVCGKQLQALVKPVEKHVLKAKHVSLPAIQQGQARDAVGEKRTGVYDSVTLGHIVRAHKLLENLGVDVVGDK